MNCVWLDANKYWANIASAIRGGTLAIAAVLAGTQESEVAVCLMAFRKILSVQSHLHGVTVLLGRSNHPAATVEERCSKTVCFANSRELNLRTVSIERCFKEEVQNVPRWVVKKKTPHMFTYVDESPIHE